MSGADLTSVPKSLPRQLSVLRGAPHYDPKAKELSGKIDVLLDGKVLPEVASYDVDNGEIIRNRRYKDGGLVISQGQPVLDRLTGRVEVRWKDSAA